MKSKTINRILTAKHRSWCNSITDETVRKIAQDNTIITGGAIVSMLLNEPISDFDLYIRTPEAAYAISQYYVKKLLENPPPAFKGSPDRKVEIYALKEEAIPEGIEKQRINGVVKGPQPARVRIVVKSAGVAGEAKQTDYQYFEGTNAAEQGQLTDDYVSRAVGEVTDPTEPDVEFTALDDEEGPRYVEATTELDEIDAGELEEAKPVTKEEKEKAEKQGRFRVLFVTSNAITLSDKVQIVIRFQGEPDEIHTNYDYVHCTSYWTSWDKKLVLRPEAMECILAKELRYIGSKYPVCSLIRTRKFISRGWTINAGQFVKMAFQVSRLNLTDPVVLEDQLVGVDSAYFAQVISALKERVEKRAADGHGALEVDGTYLCTLIDKIF